MWLRTTLLLGLLSGCASTASRHSEAPPVRAAPAPVAPAPASKPDLQALATRELAPLPLQPVSTPDGSFSGEVEASAPPSFQHQEGLWVLSVPIGTRSPMTCFLSSEPLDAGGALYRLVRMAAQRSELQRVHPTNVRLIGDGAAMFAEAQYLADTPQGRAAGLAKMMVHADDQVPLVCTQDELGYSATFQRIATGLAASLKGSAPPPPAPRYLEFSVLRSDGHPVGFEKRVTRDAPGGSKLTEVETSLLLPRSDKEWLVRDTVTTELSDRDGRLVARDHVRAIQGEVDLQVSLERQEGRVYHYEGKAGGKALSGTFTASQELATEPGTARALREQVLPGKVKELTQQLYDPSANPEAPVAQVWRRASAAGRDVTVERGALSASLTLDAQGLVEKAVLSLEGLRLEQERVSVRGTP